MMRAGGASILKGLFAAKVGNHATLRAMRPMKIPNLVSKPVSFYVSDRGVLGSSVHAYTKRFYSTTSEKNSKDEASSKESSSKSNTEQKDQKEQKDGANKEQASPKSGKSGLRTFILVLGGSLGVLGLVTSNWFRELYKSWVDQLEEQFPSNRALLPPLLPPPYGPKYTIVVDLDALVEYAPRNGGLVLTKRAGVDYFLSQLSKIYEVVLYTKEMAGTNQIVVYKLDPQGQYFHHQLFRESGLKKDERFLAIEDYPKFNRDPSKVVVVDSTFPNAIYDNANVICVGRGDPKNPDTTLIDLAPILLEMAKRDPDDIRSFVKELHTDDLENTMRRMLGRPSVSKQEAPAAQKGGSWFGFLGK